ncbi:DNA mismatch repair protein MutS, partial [bacterium]|nr:DNA mismatch repair protein MutS [bacterium]
DFYEMFGDDAREASKILQIVLTSRGGRPMCGIPYHAVDNYLLKIVSSGRKVAIVEQLEEPSKGKKIVDRGVVRVVTPGTLTEDILSPDKNNFILGVYPQKEFFGCVLADISTGEMSARKVSEKDFPGFLKTADKITEAVYPEGSVCEKYFGEGIFRAPVDKNFFSEYEGREKLKELFKVNSLKGFDMDEGILLSAAAALLNYLAGTKLDILPSIKNITRIRDGENLFMDASTIRNLELVENLSGTPSCATLFSVLNRTLTPAGSRLLKKRLLNPSARPDIIRRRQKEMLCFMEDSALKDSAGAALSAVKDTERAFSRIIMTGGHIADFMNILSALKAAEILAQKLKGGIFGGLNFLPGLMKILDKAVALDQNGRAVINSSFDPRMEKLSAELSVLEKWVNDFEAGEREKSGIPKLKVSFNSVFGYYIEVTKVNLGKVPENYIRKQTLVNSERFITHELKEKETEILILKDELGKIEKEAWKTLANSVKDELSALKELSGHLAAIDVARSSAAAALSGNYIIPEINDGDEILIKDSRHPVVEKIHAGTFTPNDIKLNRGTNQIMLITGPNMAGKSTYIRQTALCVIMAQAGGGIPASSAKIGVSDRIFTRIGAGDNLAQDASTFMVEMNEAANILNNSTDKSLIIIDELGRGTSTYDGISIAWACLEYIAEDPRHCRCLFATHFFELVELEEKFGNI